MSKLATLLKAPFNLFARDIGGREIETDHINPYRALAMIPRDAKDGDEFDIANPDGRIIKARWRVD